VILLLRKLSHDVPALFGLGVILCAILIALFANQLAPFPGDAYESHVIQRLKPPSWEFPLGTDGQGRDILSRLILGTRGALLAAFAVVGATTLIGVPLGLIAGYFGGWPSELIMRVTDTFLAVPQLVLAMVLAQLLSPSLESALIALVLTYWPFFTRIVYAETRRLKSALFVEALRALNNSSARILFLHILPNAAPSIIVRATIGMGFTILTAALLGFLGMGATPPEPDWGLAISESRDYLPEAWWASTFPGLAILLLVLGFNLFGDGLRDLVDPRLRRSRG
jgi:peptide/nickel transport system permease protein